MSHDTIFLLDQDDQLLEMNETVFDSEDFLQCLIAKNPNLLAGRQIDPDSPRRWLLVSRETPVPSDESGASRWSLDHLFLDQDGIPTLVEVKRSSDTRIRREVVGQLLDYAANAVLYWPVEDIRSRFESRCERERLDCDAVLRDFVRSTIDHEQFWNAVKTNLQAEKIRLVFVADDIPTELQRIVEFLNGQMTPAEVIAIEIKQFKGEERITLVPRVVGRTARATTSKRRGGKRQWDESSFFAELSNTGSEDDCAVAHELLKWAGVNGFPITWGQGRTFGTFYPNVACEFADLSLFGVSTSGKIEVVFGPRPDVPRDSKVKLLRCLNSIPGIEFPEKAVDSWGSFPIAAITGEDRRRRFLTAIEEFAAGLSRTAAPHNAVADSTVPTS